VCHVLICVQVLCQEEIGAGAQGSLQSRDADDAWRQAVLLPTD
jgi:hypothetical protein